MGALAGGYAIGISVARKYHFLNPQHAAIWAVSNAISALIVHQLFKVCYGDNYEYDTPRSLQVVVSLSVSTLITGAVANALGVQLLFSAALKIMFGAAVAGALGWVIGRGCSGSSANAADISFPSVEEDQTASDTDRTGAGKPKASAPSASSDHSESAAAAAPAAKPPSGDNGSDHEES
jgi:hypothetical protein